MLSTESLKRTCISRLLNHQLSFDAGQEIKESFLLSLCSMILQINKLIELVNCLCFLHGSFYGVEKLSAKKRLIDNSAN